MSKDFLPQGYEIPTSSNYMKFTAGTNTFRILDNPVMGMEFWNTKPDGKRVPIRRRMGEVVKMTELEINPKSGKIESPAHFWAMPVWNYKAKAVQILEIKQKSILEAIKSYAENPKWGSPTEYDINITKSGEGLETKYLTDHDPKEPVDKEIVKAYKDMNINLEALFTGEDPFAQVETVEETPESIFTE